MPVNHRFREKDKIKKELKKLENNFNLKFLIYPYNFQYFFDNVKSFGSKITSTKILGRIVIKCSREKTPKGHQRWP